MKIHIINGPNLNLLGKREPEIYGTETFADILAEMQAQFPEIELSYFQSNHEGAIIDELQKIFHSDIKGLIINAGAFTHYSYAIYDALKLLNIPKIEVHLSHIFVRESFRHTSVLAAACEGMISGLGKEGYFCAVRYLWHADFRR